MKFLTVLKTTFMKPWTLFFTALVMFSLAYKFDSGVAIIWGVGLIIASIFRAVTIDSNHNVHFR